MALPASPTIDDVARVAGVSTSTVSKALNGYKGVSQGARQRIEAAIDKLGYTPNRAARSFRTGRTHTASVFLPRLGSEFYDRLITAIDGELASHDYDAALFPLLSSQRLQRYRNPDALPYQADGIILASLNPDWLFENAELPTAIPAVLVDAYHAAYDTVTVANSEGAQAATTHLLQVPAPTFMLQVEGYNDHVFASGVFIERLKGFERAHQQAGRSVSHDALITVPFDSEEARKATHNLIEFHGPFINIFASCDLLAKGVLDACAGLGLIPGDTGPRVIGFDGLFWTEKAELSTVRQPIEEMGQTAARALLDRLKHPDTPPRHQELIPEIDIRSSTKKGDRGRKS